MASSASSSSSSLPTLLLFMVMIVCSTHSEAAKVKLAAPTALTFPIRKDPKTLQYYTTIEVSSRHNYVNAVVDLEVEFLWFNCDHYRLPTYLPVACGSSSCALTYSDGCRDCDAPARPGCSNNTCAGTATNPLAGMFIAAEYGEDFFYGTSTDGRHLKSPHRLIFSCSNDTEFYYGLARQANGLIGLSRSSVALQTQFANALNLARKFSLCIPSTSNKSGRIVVGGGSYYSSSKSKQDISKLLMTTPLLINPVSGPPYFMTGQPSDEYFIGVKAIKIDDIPISLNSSLLSFNKFGDGGAKFSTLAPYTVLHKAIYKPFVRAFEKGAANKKIKQVKPVAPFEACFSSSTIRKTKLTGPDVPAINIVLQGKNAEWMINGANSMVEVKEGVSCLAFVDGGMEARTSIVLGGHQLANNLLEFDLATSKLRFVSLQLHNTTCAQTLVH